MYLLISVLIIIACILLILIVLVQNSKGGGLASNFASSNQVMGVRKTADFLEKATWTLAISLLVLSLLASLTIPRDQGQVTRSAIEDQIERNPSPSALPTFPTPVPNEGDGQEKPDGNNN
jgi:preprotein translocase subunit SecG